jgi:hypothetical protein
MLILPETGVRFWGAFSRESPFPSGHRQILPERVPFRRCELNSPHLYPARVVDNAHICSLRAKTWGVVIGQEKLEAMVKVHDFNTEINRNHVKAISKLDLIQEGSVC